jgi:SgrR family transcriptional regulator
MTNGIRGNRQRYLAEQRQLHPAARFFLFSHLYEVPLIQHCIDRDWQQDAALWRAGEMNLAVWCQQLLAEQAIVPLIHHWLMIQGQRSMRGLRMNTLGWFDFKSAWFAPPEP